MAETLELPRGRRHHLVVAPSAPTPMPIHIATSGGEIWEPGRVIVREQSDLFGLEMVLAGQVDFEQDGRSHTVNPGEVYLLQLGGQHRYATAGGHAVKRFITLTGPALTPTLNALGLGSVDVIRPRDPAAIKRELVRIAHAMSRPNLFDFARLSMLGYGLLLALAQDVTPAWPTAVTRAINHMQGHLQEALQAEDLAVVAEVSAPHLTRLFREHVGQPPHRYLQSLRLAQARVLLQQTQMPVGEVAMRCGYSDALYFSKVFAKEMGAPPTRWREARVQAKPQ